MVEGPRSCTTWRSGIRGLLGMVAEVRKGLAQVRICSRVSDRLLFGHALLLSDEGFQVIHANAQARQ